MNRIMFLIAAMGVGTTAAVTGPRAHRPPEQSTSQPSVADAGSPRLDQPIPRDARGEAAAGMPVVILQIPPPPPGWGDRDDYRGTVTAIDKISITVQAAGGKPRRFLADDYVSSRIPPPKLVAYSTTYTLSDVRIGDRVRVDYFRRNGIEECYEILILRRPGGRIPRQPSPFADTRCYWSERMQVYQDWEEKGIPPPAKYAQDMRKAPLRVLSRPYPEVAPGPRELVGRIHSSQRDDYPPDAEALARTRTLATASTVQLVNDNAPGVVTAAGKGWIMIRVDGARFARVFYTPTTLPRVRIGDRVQVWYDRFDDANVCREVEITRRAKPDAVPPATIPPAKD